MQKPFDSSRYGGVENVGGGGVFSTTIYRDHYNIMNHRLLPVKSGRSEAWHRLPQISQPTQEGENDPLQALISQPEVLIVPPQQLPAAIEEHEYAP
ncbi:MAG: hypothetical protein ACXW1R_07910 [Halobacteriota archaeon]